MATGEILPDEQLLLDENHFMNVKDENIKEILAFIFNEKFLKKKDPMRKVGQNITANVLMLIVCVFFTDFESPILCKYRNQ